jgi:hypothetical protein
VGLFGGDMYPKGDNVSLTNSHEDIYGPDLAFTWLINHAGSGDIIVLKWGDMEYVQALC